MNSEILEKLGIIPNCIYETIFTTYNSDFRPNAAPMGIMTPDMEKIVARIFTSSQTYRNISEMGCVVINITGDVSLFYLTSIGKRHSYVEPEMFKRARNVDAPILVSASAYIEAVVDRVERIDGERCEFMFSVTHGEIVDPRATPLCRAPNLILESMIHATRIEVYKHIGDTERAEQLIEQVRCYRELIKRIAKETKYDELMERIWKDIQNL